MSIIPENHNLIQETRGLYQKVIEYQQSVGFPSPVGEIWANNMRDIHEIMSSATAQDAIALVDKTFMYSINFPPEQAAPNSGFWRDAPDNPHIRDRAIDWLLKDQQRHGLDINNLPSRVQESKFIFHMNQVTRKGRNLSGNFLRTVSIADKIIRNVSWSRLRVLELGAGAGHQARTLRLMVPGCKYLIIDLPETLCFSYMHLSLSFPEMKHLYVTCEEDLAKIDDYDSVFVPVVFADKIAGRTYDLFINTASMGEMRNDIISYWMNYIQTKINLRYLFTLNRFLNTINSEPHWANRFQENQCSVLYDDQWDIINWELEPHYTKCPYMDTLHSRYVEILAKRPTKTTAELRLTKSQNLLREVVEEDWVRLAGRFNNGIMTARDNILSHDLTMNGTLFKLWESIRLNTNRDNVYWMTRYLERLTDNIHIMSFEEYHYYTGLLARL